MKRAASSLLGLLLGIGLASPVSGQYAPKSGDFLVTGLSGSRGYLFAADPTKSGQVQPVLGGHHSQSIGVDAQRT